MVNLIVTYHRIRNEPKCCSPKRFESQVKIASKAGALLTFDDGLREHYDALPILKKYGAKGYFFVVTNALREMPTAQKIWLLSEYSGRLLKELNIPNEKIGIPEQFYRFDDVKTANLKAYLRDNPSEVDSLFKQCYNEKAEIKKMFMSWSQIRELHEAGMAIGSHSHRHLAATALTDPAQEEEIRVSTGILKRKIARPFCFSYPYGVYNDASKILLKKYGYLWAVTTEPDDLFALKRIDTNDFWG